MRRHFLAPSPRFGRTNNRLALSHQQKSPYYWYWAYLRRNENYLACCANGGTGELAALYADFGDVRGDNFHKWWTENQRGATLFGEQPLSVKFGELDSAQDWPAHWDKDTVMVLAVPFAMSKRRLKGVFSKILDSRHPGNKSGRPSMAELKGTSTAKYKLERNYTITNLMTALAVYDLWTENQTKPASERMTLWQIGKALNINRKAIKDAEGANNADRLTGRNVLGATVSRYVKQARAMIENAAKGRFPLI
jgi:hypothetical protein